MQATSSATARVILQRQARLLSATAGPNTLKLHEVTPRDGLQNEKKKLTVLEKQALIQGLIDIRPNGIEVASFVRGDLVPNMAGASELCARLADDPKFTEFKRNGGYAAALVPNLKGFEEFLKNKKVLDTVVVLVSCSDSHSKANVNRPMKDAMKATLTIVDAAKKEGIKVRAYASLAFGCPFEGKVPAERVVDLVCEYEAKGADKIILADTLGVGLPEQVKDIVTRLRAQSNIGLDRLGLHLHDSHSTAHENVAEGWRQGIRDYDAAVGGCGGCNFAPGSKGNISIEKLLRTLGSIPGASHNLNVDALRAVNRGLAATLARDLEQ